MTTEPPWKILAPIEVSERDSGEEAIRYAARFAEATGAELTLLNVVPPAMYREARDVGWSPESVLDATARQDVRSLVLPGVLSGVVGQYAGRTGADLVLMTSRRSGWSSLRRNFIPAKTLRSVACPVHIADLCRVESDGFACRTILCVLQLEGNDAPVLEFASRLAQRTGARLAMLHVLPEVSEGLLAYGMGESNRPLSPAVAHDRLRKLQQGLSSPHTGLILTGALNGSVVEAAKDTAADVVVVGRAMRRRHAHADPAALMRRLHCPVISVPTEPAVERDALQDLVPVRGVQADGPARPSAVSDEAHAQRPACGV